MKLKIANANTVLIRANTVTVFIFGFSYLTNSKINV